MVALLVVSFGWVGGVSAADTRGMVSSGHPLATAAGLDVLKSGGNAIDAAVAVGLTLGVVDVCNSGIGGGCLMLIHLANGKLVAIDGRETAPAAATRDMFIRDGRAVPALSQTGALASGVPGELAAFEYAAKRFGKKQWRELVQPAADLAEQGFALQRGYAARLQAEAADLAQFEASRAVFFREGRPLRGGEILRQPDLAATYRAIAEQGSRWFYRGPFARAAEQWMRDNGGLLTAADFAKYRCRIREPIITTYRGYTIISFPPPSSGGVHVAQMLNILEHFDLKALDEATRVHVLTEAMKLAFADRAHWLGDPAFARVPRGLVSKSYAATLAGRIRLDRATEVPTHGLPPNWRRDVFKKHTTHFSVADADNNWVACTATVNTSFGSKVVIPGTGVVLNNEMDDFSAQPGVANYFGLVGAEANAIAPGKRPLSSMSPTLVLRDGQPILSLGAAGGPKIITAVLLELVCLLDLGFSPEAALAAPRFHHQWSPAELMFERQLPEPLQAALIERGHRLRPLSSGSVSHLVARSADGRSFVGAADPRSGGQAAGW
ncbi:MAG TPA: gamma-glutamyltransferase [Verrucomicrobiota bacterium]|nr:gamma-glutamyltransferase [Verrucomicrobiota bacterium]HQB16511.1 gamma-glutamyltransferase [Verrucomicrobiota bacterium]